MVINIKDKNQFIASYLRPISALTDAVIIKSKDNKLECITNNEQGLILYAAYNLEIQNDLLLNIPNVKKLEKILSFIESEELNLDYKENALSYKDKKMRFKYHFLDDNIIQAPKLSVDKILNLPYDIEFNMDSSKISELAKGAAFVAESEKLYFNISDGEIFAEITDRSNSSVDSYSILIGNSADVKDVSFPMHFDIVRLLGATNQIRIKVKINTKQGLSTFELKTETSILKYIVPGLQV
tara:strand:+ start:501 stop:1220 length:720 start_codon:yes stop_codon:yes gene_type:complete